MDPREMALFSRVFHLPAGIAVTSVHPSASELVIGVACLAPSMPCPACHQRLVSTDTTNARSPICRVPVAT